jgi:hypothetical protein
MQDCNRVPFWGSVRELPLNIHDELVVDTFTRGQCHSLARALHRLTGWPLAVMCWDPEGNPAEDGDHVVVVDPDERFVDIRGAWQPGDYWSQLEPIFVDDREVAGLGWDDQDVDAALPFAQAVLNLIGGSPLIPD